MTISPHRYPPPTRTPRPYPPRTYAPGSYMRVRDPEALRAAKDARQLSYRQLATLVGVHPSAISHLIPAPGTKPRHRQCRPEVAERIARALLVPVDALFEHRLASDPSTGDLPIVREDDTPPTTGFHMPTVSTAGRRGKHRQRKGTR